MNYMKSPPEARNRGGQKQKYGPLIAAFRAARKPELFLGSKDGKGGSR